MKLNQILRATALFCITCGLSFSLASCEDENGGSSDENFAKGTIEGVVTDDFGNPVSDVTITLMKTNAKRDVMASTQSASDGSYSFADVPMTSRFLSFEKTGYATIGVTLSAGSYTEAHATVSTVMVYAEAVIKGKVLDFSKGDAPLAGATISIGTGDDITTESDGTFEFKGLVIKDYSLTVSKTGSRSVSKKITVDMFNDGICEMPVVRLFEPDLFPGITRTMLLDVAPWYHNDYFGGKGNGGGRVDWSCSFMGTLTYVGNYEYQNEGCCLRIRNDSDQQSNPADFDNFDSFMYGRKLITADNKILTAFVRTHQGAADNPCPFGVQVVDLSNVNAKAVKVGETISLTTTDYNAYDFDLSAYVGKEIAIAIGIYRPKTGNYWVQMPIRHISFAGAKVNGDDYLPGDEIAGLEGWHMTIQNVRSLTPNEKRSFTGSPLENANKDNGWRGWRGTNHIAANWGFMYVSKDTEPTAAEGFVIKTPSDVDANYNVPCAYFYSKFAITGANDHMSLTVRTFDSNVPTTFKVTAITDAGEVKHLVPVKNNAESANAVSGGNGCWEFKQNNGNYATFEYDLSAYSGKNVTIAFGVYKGANRGGEQKLCIYGVNFD